MVTSMGLAGCAGSPRSQAQDLAVDEQLVEGSGWTARAPATWHAEGGGSLEPPDGAARLTFVTITPRANERPLSVHARDVWNLAMSTLPGGNEGWQVLEQQESATARTAEVRAEFFHAENCYLLCARLIASDDLYVFAFFHDFHCEPPGRSLHQPARWLSSITFDGSAQHAAVRMNDDDFLRALPDAAELRRTTQSLATLDAILCADPGLRYYAFDAAWADGVSVASMHDGSGDHWFATFTAAGVTIHGLAHESGTFEVERPKPWVFGELPDDFHGRVLREPAFEADNCTYCVWRTAGADRWSRGVRGRPPGAIDDGMREHLDILLRGAAGYVEWASEYHEANLSLEDVAAVFRHAPMTRELAAKLNPNVDFAALEKDLTAIGYASQMK